MQIPITLAAGAFGRPSSPPSSSSRALGAGLRLLMTARTEAGDEAEAPAAPEVPPPRTPRAFTCRCGRPVFFRNSRCLACGRALGYDAQRRELLPIEPDGDDGWWREAGSAAGAPRYRRCTQLDTASGCNWLLDEPDAHADSACRCCRLLVAQPDLAQPEAAAWFNRIEHERRRLVSALIGFGLPVRSRTEDPAQGLGFDLKRAPPGGPPVVTGHAGGVITIDLEEADDPTREQRRSALGEPYRTLLGHLRHESGHYYWQRLVEPGAALEPFRALFGDERADYAAALQAYYANGAPADWGGAHVSAYACAHPWEDWAETWAHYLHMADTVDTARSFGIDGERVELNYEPFGADVLDPDGTDAAGEFSALVRSWMELTGVLNELSRSMGVPDFYPFVLSAQAVRKLHFVHRVVHGEFA